MTSVTPSPARILRDTTGHSVSEDPLDLALSTIDHIRSGHLGPTQSEGQSDFETWWKAHFEGPIEITKDKWNTRDLFSLLRALSKMIFIKQIPAHHAALELRLERNLYALKDALGFCQHIHIQNPRNQQEQLIVRIMLDPEDLRTDLNLETHQLQICSTLLHEMIHAYLFSYSCDTYHDRGRCTQKGKLLWPIDRAHCLAWFHLACAIELWMEDSFGLKINLGCFRSYVLDIETGGLPLFAPEWKRFFELHGWIGACRIFGKLSLAEARRLSTCLEADPLVMQVWAEQGEEHDEPL